MRKAAAEILPKIASFCDVEIKSKFLLEIFKNFTKDPQKYVRIAAIEVFGQFLVLLKQEDLNNSLINFYVEIMKDYYTSKDSSVTNETEVFSS